MKKYTLFILLILNGYISKAQTNLDSLWNIWQQEELEDTTRLEALFEICNQPGVITDANTLSKYSAILFENAKSLRSEKYLGLGYLFRARIFSLKGEFNGSLILLDSSRRVFQKIGDKFNEARSLSNAASILNAQGNPVESIRFGSRAIELMEEIDNIYGLAGTHSSLGMIYGNLNLVQKQIYYSNKGLKFAQKTGDKAMISQSMHAMAHAYVNIEDHEKAREYHLATLQMMSELESDLQILTMKQHIAAEDIKSGNYTEAIEILTEYLEYEGVNKNNSMLMNGLLNMAEAYAGTKDFEKAIFYANKVKKLRQLKVGAAQVNESLASLHKIESQIAMGTSNYSKAVAECENWLEFAPILGGLTHERDACDCLYRAYKALGNGNKALEYKEQYSDIQDSIDDLENKKKMQQLEFARQLQADSLQQVEKDRLVQIAHEEEVRKKNNIKNGAIGIGLLFLLLAGGYYSRWRYVRKSRDIISKEKERSDNLLLNILPAEIAEELKIKGKADARDFEKVSILFTDFKEFTQTSEKLSAQDLVSEINVCFEAFDGICGKYRVEKIKTIGDAYMAAGGLPVPNEASVKNTVLAALEMQEFIVDRKKEKDAQGEVAFEMRVGIHTGGVVAGIVGVKKFQYDIWGDTVNTASRIESSGAVGQINISQATYELLKDDPDFNFESRGKIEAKGKGEVEMYFVTKT